MTQCLQCHICFSSGLMAFERIEDNVLVPFKVSRTSCARHPPCSNCETVQGRLISVVGYFICVYAQAIGQPEIS